MKNDEQESKEIEAEKEKDKDHDEREVSRDREFNKMVSNVSSTGN